MATEITTPRTLEFVSGDVGMLVLELIVLDGYIKIGDTFGANKQKATVQDHMEALDCVQLSEAMYHYETATGKLDTNNTYLR